MTACRSHTKSTSNPVAAISTAQSHVTILSAAVGEKAVADNQPQKLRRESQVGLGDGPLRLSYPVSTLSINGQVQDHPPLGGLSQRWLMQKLTIFDNLPSAVKLDSERGPISINILTV